MILHEVFASIQGEGYDTGLPTVFVRFFGCNVHCVYCDQPQKRSECRTVSVEKVVAEVRRQLMGIHIEKPVEIKYTYFEPNKKRDLDNISAFAHKVIQDGLVKGGLLENDGWKNIVGFSDDFYIDKDNPRIEILIREVDD